MAKRFHLAGLLCGLVLLAFEAAAGTQDPRAVLPATDADFGRAVQGEVIERAFLVKNEGAAPLTLKFRAISMRGIKVKYQRSVPPGEQAEVVLTLDTSGMTGEVKAQALFEFDDPARPQAILTLAGVVVPAIEILPYPAVYFSFYPGETLERSVTFVNNQDHPVKVLSLAKQGQHFEARLETVEDGKAYKVHVSVPDGVAPGRYREALLIQTDAPGGKVYPVAVNIFVKPDLFVYPDSVTFGEVRVADLRRQPALLDLLRKTLVLQKRGDDFRITSIESTLPFLDITQTPDSESRKFKIDLDLAVERISMGKVDGTVTIRTDDPEFPEFVVPVRGEFK